MRVLVLGGTGFVGRSVVDEALARGADVTALNRGHRPAPAGVTALVGDRRAPDGLAGLAGRPHWDVVVDTWSAEPWVVRDAANALADRAGRYVYVSSRSVYPFPPAAHADESAPVEVATPDDGDEVSYGRAKRGGELAAQAAFGDRALVARPGLILGPYEDVGRLPWWLGRIQRGGRVLAPGPADLPLQYIDARDLASWLLDAAAAGRHGTYDTVSRSGHTTMGELLETCVATVGSDARLVWTDPEPILAAGIAPWTDLPIWIPPGPGHDGLHRSDVGKAMAAGLTCRPVERTVADTWTWFASVGGQAPLRDDRPSVGLDPDLEARLLDGRLLDGR
jgi:nucleoside-diphosphate-sugar epimerase